MYGIARLGSTLGIVILMLFRIDSSLLKGTPFVALRS
jgi:hypothetical protein